MAFNVRDGGDHGSFIVDETVKSGDAVVIGGLAGIAEVDAAPRPDGKHWATIALEGVAVVELDGTPTQGQAVGIAEGDVAEGKANTLALLGDTPGAYKLFGYVYNEHATSDGRFEVKIAHGSKEIA